MRPILFHFGEIEIPSFFLCVTVGALIATFLAARIARKEGLKEIVMLDFGIVGMIAGVMGAKLFHVFFEAPSYYWENPLRIFYLWQGGFVSVGAIIGAVLSWVAYLRIKKLKLWPYLDIAALVAPIIMFFTRLGCLLAGCCFGKPTTSWFGIIFPRGSFAGDTFPDTPLYPTQIIFQINAIVMFALLFFVFKRRKFYGQVSASFFIYYGITRFAIEFLRSSEDRHLYFGIPSAHWTMIGFILIGICIWAFTRKNRDSKL